MSRSIGWDWYKSSITLSSELLRSAVMMSSLSLPFAIQNILFTIKLVNINEFSDISSSKFVIRKILVDRILSSSNY